jgi:fatty acid desaturase
MHSNDQMTEPQTTGLEDAADQFDESFDAWYAPAVARATLQASMRRTNAHALRAFGLWLFLAVATGSLVILARHSPWVWPAMLLYGGVLCFSYAASHECAHGTAFKTRWLNEAVFWFTSLVFIEEPLYRRYSHAEHHTNTWFNGQDPQKPYGNPLSMRQYLTGTFGLTFYFDAARQLIRHSAGRFTPEEVHFLPPSQIAAVIRNSRIMSACYIGLLLAVVVLQSTLPLLLYFIPRFLGGCIVTLYINTQHMCMAEDLHDHRLTTRSIRCNWLERQLYWNMNYHIEHHLFPSVPFHALPALSKSIADQLPSPPGGVIAANTNILKAVSRQRTEPHFNLSRAR